MKRIIVVNNETMGRGSEELGAKLMGAFLRTLCSAQLTPDSIIFYNSGVKLLAHGSAVLDALEMLLQEGVDLLACGTCLAHYRLQEKIAVGRESNMQEIATLLTKSEHVTTV